MPKRTIANRKQRELFNDLSKVKKLALTTKVTDSVSVNIHGSFTLFDKMWSMVNENNIETMIALKDDDLENITGEPAVHFHIDWEDIQWACIQPRHLELINTDYELVFCSKSDASTRKFWFYLKEGIETQLLISKWGSEWINLKNNFLSHKNYSTLGISQIKNKFIQPTLN